jgi:hypothetical protein
VPFAAKHAQQLPRRLDDWVPIAAGSSDIRDRRRDGDGAHSDDNAIATHFIKIEEQ